MKPFHLIFTAIILILIAASCKELEENAKMSGVLTKASAVSVNYDTLTNNMYFNGGDLGDTNITIVLGDNYKANVTALENFKSSLPSTVTSQITETAKMVITVKNEDGTANSYNVDTSAYEVTIPVSEVKTGKNTFTYEASLPQSFLDIELPSTFSPTEKSIPTISFDVYKGSYTHSGSFEGTTEYDMTVEVYNPSSDDDLARDAMVAVNNTNDRFDEDDNVMVMLIPDDNGKISVTKLQSTGGHNVRSQNYENWVVAPANSEKGGQEVRLTYNIKLRKIAPLTAVTGTFNKRDSTADSTPTPFKSGTKNLWIHAHYHHPTSRYAASCVSGATNCSIADVTNDAMWIGATVLGLDGIEGEKNVSYDFTKGTYEIKALAGNVEYKILAFWLDKNINGDNYHIGDVTADSVVKNIDITLEGRMKQMTGYLRTSDTRIRVARKFMFNGQQMNIFSDIVQKDGTTDAFTLSYGYDLVEITNTYLLWGGDSDPINEIPATCDATSDCKEILIGDDSPSDSALDIK